MVGGGCGRDCSQSSGTPGDRSNPFFSVAALWAVQAHADVELPFGQRRPLSLYLVTVAGSGDRKSSCDREAMWPIRKREEELAGIHVLQLELYMAKVAAFTKRRSAKSRPIGSSLYESRIEAIMNLGPEPKPPLHPFLVAPDPTYEGLVKAWGTASPSLGIFSTDRRQFVGGHGMSQENRLRTAAGYSEVWDGQAIERIRSKDGVTLLAGRRLCMRTYDPTRSIDPIAW